MEVVISPGHVACSHSHALGYSFTQTHKEPLFELSLSHTHAHTHTPTPSPEWLSRRACLCQQMSGRRCVFLCRSLHSFHPLLQRLPICLWPCFISALSNLPPRGCLCVCCITVRGVGKKPLPPPKSRLLECTDTTFKIRLVRLEPRSHREVVCNDYPVFPTLTFLSVTLQEMP